MRLILLLEDVVTNNLHFESIEGRQMENGETRSGRIAVQASEHLTHCGCTVVRASSSSETQRIIRNHEVDAVVLAVPISELAASIRALNHIADIKESDRELPFLWWCDEGMDVEAFAEYIREEAVNPNDEQNGMREAMNGIDWQSMMVDGILSSGMTGTAISCTFHLSSMQSRRRNYLQRELQNVIYRLEERRWIDQAKAIIADIKKISETEAYEFMRKLAMNERRKLPDVAASIVKVYQLLRMQKSGSGDEEHAQNRNRKKRK